MTAKMSLNDQEKALLRRALNNRGVTVCGFTTDTFKTAVGLVSKGLMFQHRTASPFHDDFRLTKAGRKITREL